MSEVTECRIELLSKEEAQQAATKVGISPMMAELNVFRALLHHPELAAALNAPLTMLMGLGNVLAPRLRELIIMRIGWQTGSDYEWTQHWRVAKMFGIPETDLLAVRHWEKADCFNQADRAVLQATDDILNDGKISGETWAQLEEVLGDTKQVLEVLIAICNWRTFSQLLMSIQIPLEDGIESWPPDGLVPEAAYEAI
ncbi:MAG TPA: carboxymuconolactone decarboxylase family protein [Pseudomonadales bacterium]